MWAGEEEIGTILCAERWCCLSSLLGYWAQSWTGRHSDSIPAWWHSFCRPRKDDGLSQPHLVLIQQLSGIWTQDPRTPSPPPEPLSQHQANCNSLTISYLFLYAHHGSLNLSFLEILSLFCFGLHRRCCCCCSFRKLKWQQQKLHWKHRIDIHLFQQRLGPNRPWCLPQCVRTFQKRKHN